MFAFAKFYFILFKFVQFVIKRKKKDTDENNVNYIQHKLSTVQLSIKLKYSINFNHIHSIAVLTRRILTTDYPKNDLLLQ